MNNSKKYYIGRCRNPMHMAVQLPVWKVLTECVSQAMTGRYDQMIAEKSIKPFGAENCFKLFPLPARPHLQETKQHAADAGLEVR